MRQKSDERWRETIRSSRAGRPGGGEFATVDADDFAITLSALLDGLAVQIALEDPVGAAAAHVRAEHAVRGGPAGV